MFDLLQPSKNQLTNNYFYVNIAPTKEKRELLWLEKKELKKNYHVK